MRAQSRYAPQIVCRQIVLVSSYKLTGHYPRFTRRANGRNNNYGDVEKQSPGERRVITRK